MSARRGPEFLTIGYVRETYWVPSALTGIMCIDGEMGVAATPIFPTCDYPRALKRAPLLRNHVMFGIVFGVWRDGESIGTI